MDKILKQAGSLLGGWRTEPAVFFYMFASFLKMPVFQNLLFEKSCWDLYNDDIFCANVTAYHMDTAVQTEANRLFFYSSICLILPSIPASLILGSMADRSRLRLCLLIPFCALLISSLVYILLSILEHSSPYLLLISDVIFGVAGGYTSIIGVAATHSVRGTTGPLRSSRVARLEASIGLGGTVGYALSGSVRKALGYTAVFSLIFVLQLVAVVYILIFIKNDEYQDIDEVDRDRSQSLLRQSLLDPMLSLAKPRPFRYILIALFLAFGLELFAFAGISDIQYPFMRYRLAWDDVAYGLFSSLTFLFGTIGVLFLYPFLRLLLSDVMLGCMGLVLKMCFLIVLSSTHSSVVVFSTTVLFLGSRFVSTAFRTQIANLVEDEEQGKISSLVSILEGVTGILASAALNNLYPVTLQVWSGICPIIIVVLLAVALVVLIFSRYHLQQHDLTESEEAIADSQTSE